MEYIVGMKAFLKFVAAAKLIEILLITLYKMSETGGFEKLSVFLERKGFRWFGLKLVNSIPLENNHTCVMGITRHGKTYAVMHSLKNCDKGVLFFNVQREDTPKNFIKASRNNSWSQIKELLKEGKKINYLPSDDLEDMQKEVKVLIDQLYKSGEIDCYIAIDEVHLISKDGLKACIRLATTGLRFGYKGIFLTQRGAKMDNTLLTQATQHVFFALGRLDISYLKNNGFPVDEITSKTGNEKYKFVVFNQKEVEGAFKIKA